MDMDTVASLPEPGQQLVEYVGGVDSNALVSIDIAGFIVDAELIDVGTVLEKLDLLR